VACADVLADRAREKAGAFGIPRVCTVEELLRDEEIELVLNLTVPKAHADVALAVIAAGKSVHGEKPFAVTREEGKRILAAAADRGVRVGCAPDTFLGGGLQTCRKLIDDGEIGEPVAATAFVMFHGHENWHPSPEFYYEQGGGPMFDMGPYYLTALVTLLGPVKRVTGSARASFPERTVTSAPKKGKRIRVETPTHVAGVMDFACGAIGTIIASFDVWNAAVPHIEIYGSKATLSLPDPNTFEGPVRISRGGETEWGELALTHGYAENVRGIGAADLAVALRTGRAHRASGELAYHVLDVMEGFLDASRESRHVEIASAVERPAPMPQGLVAGELDP
ncbi:MAG: Gfo/Idh/MocA family oxidoreductase, partial [Planctomycetota bacterium]